MHCDAFPSSLRTSLHPSALGLLARFAVTRGPAPWTPAEERGPSDSLRFLGIYLQRRVSPGKISHEASSAVRVRFFHEAMRQGEEKT